MNRRPNFLLFWLILCAAASGPGCRSVKMSAPIWHIQHSTGQALGATASSSANDGPSRRQTGSNTNVANQPVFCSRDVPLGDADEESVLPASLSEHADDAELNSERVGIDQICDEPIAFRSDLSQAGCMLWEDTKALFEWRNAAILGAGLGGALAIRSTLDDDVRAATLHHENRWGEGSLFLSDLGEPYVQWPAWLALYSYSVYTEDKELHDLSRSLFSAMAITSVSTVAIKGIANTSRPTGELNNGKYGFPSYHAASSFAIAGVVDEYYGLRAGLPAYVLAGLIGWSRIDGRDHDLSDVVFGSVLGLVIGKSVAHFHRTGDGRFHLSPWYEPSTNSSGVMMEMTFD